MNAPLRPSHPPRCRWVLDHDSKALNEMSHLQMLRKLDYDAKTRGAENGTLVDANSGPLVSLFMAPLRGAVLAHGRRAMRGSCQQRTGAASSSALHYVTLLSPFSLRCRCSHGGLACISA